MIDLRINEQQLARTVERAREKNIIMPTLAWQKDPSKIPGVIREKLRNVGLWEINSWNLFRTTWKNHQTESGVDFGDVNVFEIPSEITGVKARIYGLVGKFFPTGAHKVGATYGCLMPRLVTGQFDPTSTKAVWPSTGNYCRGGAYTSQLLACDSIAILPEEMSKERFEWLADVAGEIIRTPGTESNVKEIFDKCWELKRTRDNIMIFNQFEEHGNYLWHYEVTGSAMVEVLEKVMGSGDNFAGMVVTTGSAGTIASGDRLKQFYPHSKIVASETLQCPTLLNNGFGAHRIEGIGDKHVPWIHNVRNTDMVTAIDDNDSMALLRLFNDPIGQEYLMSQGVSSEVIEKLPLLGISGIANLLSAIKFAKYYELTEKDVVLTVFTDSMEMYGSRLEEMAAEEGTYTPVRAAIDHHRSLLGQGTDNMQELTYLDRKRIHNLKYYTWIEQQGRDLDELNAQWYDHDQYWGGIQKQGPEIDRLIDEFNRRTGLLQKL
jgi:cysteine synthase